MNICASDIPEKSALSTLKASVTPISCIALIIESLSNILSMLNLGRLTLTSVSLCAFDLAENALRNAAASPRNALNRVLLSGSRILMRPPLSNVRSTRCQPSPFVYASTSSACCSVSKVLCMKSMVLVEPCSVWKVDFLVDALSNGSLQRPSA